MSFLTSLLPGARELRIPLVCGALWTLLLALILEPSLSHLVESNPGIAAVSRLLTSAPAGVQGAALLAAAYLLGMATNTLSQNVARGVAAYWTRRIVPPLQRKQFRRGPGWFRWRVSRLHSRLVYGSQRMDRTPAWVLLEDAVAARFGQAGAPPDFHYHFPTRALFGQLDVTALQLWQASPKQYEEYDRLMSEARLRIAMLAPLAGLGLWATARVSPWLGPAFVVLLALIWRDGRDARQRCQESVASAINLGMIDIPLLSAVLDEVGARDVARTEVDWTAAMAISLIRRGRWSLAHDVVGESSCMVPGTPERVAILNLIEEESPEFASEYMTDEEIAAAAADATPDAAADGAS